MTTRQMHSNAEKAALKVAGASPSDGRNYANATCANIDRASGQCLDYALLHKFMLNLAPMRDGTGHQVVNSTRHTARCAQSLQEMQFGATCSKANPKMC